VRLIKIGLLPTILALALTLIYCLTRPTVHKSYLMHGSAGGGTPSLTQIIEATGEDLHPQMLAGTLPQLSWFLAFDKAGLSAYAKYVPSWLNVDMSFVYDALLNHHAYFPTGGILLYKYNFTTLDDPDALYKYIAKLNRYATKFQLRDAANGDIFDVEIKPFTFSDCVPNNIPKHYCRVFSSDTLKTQYPHTKDLSEAIRQYAAVTNAYQRIQVTSPLGPNVDLADNGWTASQTETYAREVALYMQAKGVVPTLKHFGYNASKGDTHFGAYRDDRPLSELMGHDFKPYFTVNALSRPFFIMTTHFYMTAIDPHNVTTRSSKILRFIRENFPNAIVMTDEVSMSGFSEKDSYEQRIMEAKGDLILTHSGLGLDMWSRRAAIYKGVFARDRSDARASLLKILKMKQKLGLLKITRAHGHKPG
jgi:hypothetical protein